MDWARVGTLIRARMRATGQNQAELSRRSGVSVTTVRALMDGKRTEYRSSTLAKIERALGWTPGDIDRIGHGEEPTAIAVTPADHDLDRRVDVLEARFSSIEEEVRRLASALEALQELDSRRPAAH